MPVFPMVKAVPRDQTVSDGLTPSPPIPRRSAMPMLPEAEPLVPDTYVSDGLPVAAPRFRRL